MDKRQKQQQEQQQKQEQQQQQQRRCLSRPSKNIIWGTGRKSLRKNACC
jgi:hypothetical protein